MTRFAACVIIVSLRLIYQPSQTPQPIPPFASPLPPASSTTVVTPLQLLECKGWYLQNRMVLIWAVTENESADRFEVEKSTDGKNFHLAGLVFGTDSPRTDHYEFYEKSGRRKTTYRIRMIGKDRQACWSGTVQIDPKS